MPYQIMDSHERLDPATWLNEHGDYLYRYAMTRLDQPQAAEDLVQETFLAALRARDRFGHESSERTWLVGILKHKLLDHLRKKHREQPVKDLAADGILEELFDRRGHWKRPIKVTPNPGAAVERQEFWQTFAGCLGKLPENQAHAFVLREIDGLDSSEICDTLNVSTTNLFAMLHRARLRLWRCLEINWFGVESNRT